MGSPQSTGTQGQGPLGPLTPLEGKNDTGGLALELAAPSQSSPCHRGDSPGMARGYTAPKHQPGPQPWAVLCSATELLPTKTLVPSYTCDLDAIFRNTVTCQGQTLTWLQRCLCFVTSFCICSSQRSNHTGQDARVGR